MAIIELNNLVKKFNGFTAVDGVTLSIGEGEVFGLLGPNGAGKTTTISMLCTILKPTSGTASLCGHDIVSEKDAVRKCIGVVFQDQSLDDELTGRENLDLHGRLYGMGSTRTERAEEVLKLVELVEFADKPIKTYSGGMKRRLEIARGLMHYPKILFLDEPTIGLDPQTRRRLWDYIRDFNKTHGVTIILTTHYMDEADFLCNRIAIMDKGKIIAQGTSEQLKEVLQGDVITIESEKAEELSKLLSKEKYLKAAKMVGKDLVITAKNGSEAVPALVPRIRIPSAEAKTRDSPCQSSATGSI